VIAVFHDTGCNGKGKPFSPDTVRQSVPILSMQEGFPIILVKVSGAD